MEVGRSFERRIMKGRWQLTEEPQSKQWLEKRRVAAVLRRLGETCLRSDISTDKLAEAAEALSRIETELGAQLGPTFFDALADGSWEADQGHYADRNPLLGLCNANSPPLFLRDEGEMTLGQVEFDYRFEGAPGYVHGGVISAVFDQLFGSVMIRSERPAMTGELSVRFLKPTPLKKEILVSGHIVGSEGRRVFCEGEITCDGVTLAEGTCTMVRIDDERLMKIFDPAKRTRVDGVSGG